jgi:CRISPR/Cas system endoribonuclease Cas6 (RAMP superfamily)
LQITPAYRAAIDALATFAIYAGSGHHTTQGMGLTRLE